MFTSCSRMREAQSVLCEADSLRSEGQVLIIAPDGKTYTPDGLSQILTDNPFADSVQKNCLTKLVRQPFLYYVLLCSV